MSPKPLPPMSFRSRDRSVLIVDRSPDSRDVIRTVLQRRGVRTLEAPDPAAGLHALRLHRPEVVVLDWEVEPEEEHRWRKAFDAELASHPAEMVVLGNVRCEDASRRHVVSKPYHYGPLIQKIEELIGECETR